MKFAVLVLIATGLGSLVGQEIAPSPPLTDPATAFAVRPPDENSPFFLDAEMARRSSSPGFRNQQVEGTVAEYPQNKNSPNSAAAQIAGFFTGMFSSVRIGPLHSAPTTTKLLVEPPNFSLKDRRELTVTYSVRNNTKNMTRLEYPNSQRMDILTYDPQGKIIDRWSDDRSFDNQEGIVVINPNERIQYEEKIATREMKAGETYKVEAFTMSEPKFLSQKFITPK